MKPAEIGTRQPGIPALPDAVQELLERFVQLARELEPYVVDHSGDSIYIVHYPEQLRRRESK